MAARARSSRPQTGTERFFGFPVASKKERQEALVLMRKAVAAVKAEERRTGKKSGPQIPFNIKVERVLKAVKEGRSPKATAPYNVKAGRVVRAIKKERTAKTRERP